MICLWFAMNQEIGNNCPQKSSPILLKCDHCMFLSMCTQWIFFASKQTAFTHLSICPYFSLKRQNKCVSAPTETHGYPKKGISWAGNAFNFCCKESFFFVVGPQLPCESSCCLWLSLSLSLFLTACAFCCFCLLHSASAPLAVTYFSSGRCCNHWPSFAFFAGLFETVLNPMMWQHCIPEILSFFFCLLVPKIIFPSQPSGHMHMPSSLFFFSWYILDQFFYFFFKIHFQLEIQMQFDFISFCQHVKYQRNAILQLT